MVRLFALLAAVSTCVSTASAGPLHANSSLTGLPTSVQPGQSSGSGGGLAMFRFDLSLGSGFAAGLSGGGGAAGSGGGGAAGSAVAGGLGFGLQPDDDDDSDALSKLKLPFGLGLIPGGNGVSAGGNGVQGGGSGFQSGGSGPQPVTLPGTALNPFPPVPGTELAGNGGPPVLITDVLTITRSQPEILTPPLSSGDLFGSDPVTNPSTGDNLPGSGGSTGNVSGPQLASLPAPVMTAPEPSAYVLFATGLIGVCALRRRSRRADVKA